MGCAVWACKDWVGNFFPAKSRPQEFLELYSRRFSTVEGNTTFYVVPSQNTVKRWVTDTPTGFKFCLKLPKSLTHNGLLVPSIPRALQFLEQMQALGDRLGPIFAQLPPTYTPSFYDDLAEFLRAWPSRTVPLALEVRHNGWFREPFASRLTALLEELQIGRVLLDSRPIYNAPYDSQLEAKLFTQERRKPKLPLQLSVTANFSLVRFISHPQPEFNQVFLNEWVNHIDRWMKQGIDTYFFMHCPIEERSPANAYDFQSLLEKHSVPVPLLPINTATQPARETQLSLFN